MTKLSPAHTHHWKYPGGLEQFATNYEEAYTELDVIRESHLDTEK